MLACFFYLYGLTNSNSLFKLFHFSFLYHIFCALCTCSLSSGIKPLLLILLLFFYCSFLHINAIAIADFAKLGLIKLKQILLSMIHSYFTSMCQSSPPPWNKEEGLCYLMHLFIVIADLTEKAIAAFQALIEFNCFVPKDVEKLPGSSQKPFFEAFWDSDVPRYKRTIDF